MPPEAWKENIFIDWSDRDSGYSQSHDAVESWYDLAITNSSAIYSPNYNTTGSIEMEPITKVNTLDGDKIILAGIEFSNEEAKKVALLLKELINEKIEVEIKVK